MLDRISNTKLTACGCKDLLLVPGLFLSALLVLAVPEARGEFDYRSIFVDRFDYTYNSGNIPAMTAQIDGIMQNSADLGFKHVIFQVRGRADALYDSNFEPPASGLTPGFDPLQTAIDAAHARGLKLHAWINSTPMWNGSTTPPTGHVAYNTDPSFRLVDINGNTEPLSGWSNYSSVNPVLPEVHNHINNVVNDIATNYEVDGIHLDYIRYVPGALNTTRLPHDPISHQMFFDATGLNGGDPANFQEYKSFVKSRITDLVASIKQTVDAAEVTEGRLMELTASVWRDPDVGENDYIQDYRTWLEQDLLDVAMPMIYLRANNDSLFNPNLLNTLGIPTNAKVAPTLGVYLHDTSNGGVDLTVSQLQRAYSLGADGVGVYDYPAIFNDSLPANTGLAPARRDAIAGFFNSIDSPPVAGPGNVIDDFEVAEGHFGWAYNLSPVSQTNGLASSTSLERVTHEAQSGGASQELNLVASAEGGAWNLRHNSGIGAGLNSQPAGNAPLAPTGYVGLWLKTDDPGISIQLGIDDPVAGGATAIEKGSQRSVTADNQWHLYQWNLEDANDWVAFGNAGSDGDIDATAGTVTIDSIFFSGAGSVQMYMDAVSHNPAGPLTAAGDFDGDGVVDGADLVAWMQGVGAAGEPEFGDGDGDGDGDVDGADFLVWQRTLGMSNAASASTIGANAVPEPALAVIAVGVAWLLVGTRPARLRRR